MSRARQAALPAAGPEVVVHHEGVPCVALRTAFAPLESSEMDIEFRLEEQADRCFACGHPLAACDGRAVQVVLA